MAGVGTDQTTRSVETRAAEVTLEPNGTMVIRVKHVDMTAELMREILDARFSFGFVKRPVLVDSRRVRSMTRESQEVTATEEVRPYTDCIAIIVANGLSVVLANFYLIFVRPRFPTRMFRCEEKARSWIAETRSTSP